MAGTAERRKTRFWLALGRQIAAAESSIAVTALTGSPPNTVGSTNLIRVHEVGTDS